MACRSTAQLLKMRKQFGFTLVETMLMLLAFTLFVGVCLSAVVFNRLASIKAKEQGIARDFLIHYVETTKAMPFGSIRAGSPISPLFDGSAGSPRITIPPDGAWISVATDAFETFHPDLAWIRGRNPAMQVQLTTETSGGTEHNKHLKVRLEWDGPLRHANRTEAHVDVVRFKDL